jgi:hypothetical protein
VSRAADAAARAAFCSGIELPLGWCARVTPDLGKRFSEPDFDAGERRPGAAIFGLA